MAPCAWQSLPPALLGRCLRTGSPSDLAARFATCTSFTKAMLLPDPDLTDPHLTVRVHDSRPALAAVLHWAEECRFRLELVCLNEEQRPASLQPLLGLWQQEGVVLTGVKKVLCKGLLLGNDGLSALLPNLQELQMVECQVAEDMLPLAGCNQLQKLILDPGDWNRTANSDPPAAWHLQLAGLPSLTSLTLNTCCHRTSILPPLADQLTHLYLCGWGCAESEYQYTAQLTNLRALELSYCGPEQLIMLRTLPHLRQLTIDYIDDEPYDPLISAALQLPHVTSLTLPYMELEQSYADQPCGWRELSLTNAVSPQTLARLPLQSVCDLRLHGLDLESNITAADVVAAVANISRGQQQQQPAHAVNSNDQPKQQQLARAVSSNDNTFVFWGGEDEDVPAVAGGQADSNQTRRLRAVAALVPRDITTVTLRPATSGCWAMDAATVVALQQATPPTVTSVTLHDCIISPSLWPQLATSFPQLKKLRIQPINQCSPMEVMSYYCAACVAHHHPGTPQVSCVEISSHSLENPEGREDWFGSYSGFNEQLRLLGIKATVVFGDDVE